MEALPEKPLVRCTWDFRYSQELGGPLPVGHVRSSRKTIVQNVESVLIKQSIAARIHPSSANFLDNFHLGSHGYNPNASLTLSSNSCLHSRQRNKQKTGEFSERLMGRIVDKGQETTRVCAQPTSVGRGLVFDDLSVCFTHFGVVHEIGCSRLAVWQGETAMTKRKFLTPEQGDRDCKGASLDGRVARGAN